MIVPGPLAAVLLDVGCKLRELGELELYERLKAELAADRKPISLEGKSKVGDGPLSGAERAKRYRASRKPSRTVTEKSDASRDESDGFRDAFSASRASERVVLSLVSCGNSERTEKSEGENSETHTRDRHGNRHDDRHEKSDAPLRAVTSREVSKSWNDALSQARPGCAHPHSHWRADYDEIACRINVRCKNVSPREALSALVDYAWRSPAGLWPRLGNRLDPAMVLKRLDNDLDAAWDQRVAAGQ